jgi:uncharacterized protein
MKTRYNKGEPHHLYFWRDNTGNEIDLICEQANSLLPVEIKSGKTITNEYFRNMHYWLKLSGKKSGKIIYAGKESQHRSNGISVLPWTRLDEI